MALTTNVDRPMQLRGHEVSAPAAGTDVFYKGALVNIDANGDVAVAADTANHKFFGVVTEYKSAVEDDLIRVRFGDIVELPLSGAAQTDLMKAVYATADDTITTTAATNVLRCGLIVEVDVTNAKVKVDMSFANAPIS